MKRKVQLVVCDDEGHEATSTAVVVLEKACQRLEHPGVTLPEATPSLTALQQRLVAQQTAALVAARAPWAHWGKTLGITGCHTRTFRPLFGTITLASPRLIGAEPIPAPLPQTRRFPARRRHPRSV